MDVAAPVPSLILAAVVVDPVGSGGELRNDGSAEVVLLAGLIIPLPAGTPVAGTPVPLRPGR